VIDVDPAHGVATPLETAPQHGNSQPDRGAGMSIYPGASRPGCSAPPAASSGITLIVVFGVRLGVLPARPARTSRQATSGTLIERSSSIMMAPCNHRCEYRQTGAGAQRGSNSGFIRGVMRGLMRERQLHEVSRYGACGGGRNGPMAR
jgi:hypothetical protein